MEKIPILNFQVCPQCEKIITEKGELCQNCRRYARKNPFYLKYLIAATNYNENNISKIVHSFKYNLVQDLHIPLGKILIKGIIKSEIPLPDFIISVPLHPRRLRWRGFNQSELLAKYVSQKLTSGFEIPILGKLLIRRKYTSPQMKVRNYSARKSNILDAFAINPELSEKIKNKKVLVIDDIATTSATLMECAKVLKKNGARQVFAAVIARQVFN